MPPDYDYLVVGSGIAGLSTALQAVEHGRVAVVTKGRLVQSNTRFAQGGIAAAVAGDDSPELHERDTLAAGAGLCDPEAVHVLCIEGPARVRELIRLGVSFDTVEGEIALAMEGAHSRPRVLHARGDATGAEIEHALARRLLRAGSDLFEHHLAIDLIVEGGACTGCLALDLRTGQRRELRARQTVLATGGGGRLFAHTTNPPIATADGVAVALRAGAEVCDLEFFQFHPTALMKPGAPRFLISEAARGDGAWLLNTRGERFMPRYHPRAELAPRDVVARAILAEMAATGAPHVWLDLTRIDPARVEAHFPTISRVCRRYGIEITRDPIPVAPAAHYMIGGIRTDIWGRTSLPGLYACGEAACTGVHGANRLASNSLLEAVVFAKRIVEASHTPAGSSTTRQGVQMPAGQSGTGSAAEPGQGAVPSPPPIELRVVTWPPAAEAVAPSLPRLRTLLWEQVGITRRGEGLAMAEARLRCWLAGYRPHLTRPAIERANMLLVGWQMALAALAREESRGAHYRADFPEPREEWRKRLAWRLERPRPLELHDGG